MNEIMATMLGGSLLFAIYVYMVMIAILLIKALHGELPSDSKGMRPLKHQKYNSAYHKVQMWTNHRHV